MKMKYRLNTINFLKIQFNTFLIKCKTKIKNRNKQR